MFQVIIIEDDPMVAAINRQYVELTPSFQVARLFKNGIPALEYLKNHPVDLIILDYYTPNMNGDEFIDRLRSAGFSTAVIMVTSANDSGTVLKLLSRGVTDYLVKPFEYSRFQAALERFKKRQQSLTKTGDGMDQSAIDRLFTPQETAVSPERLAKGLNANTLHLIREFLRNNPGKTWSGEEIAEQVHLSRITIRRYMNFMAETGEIVNTIDYQTGGRPSIRYRYVR